MDVLRCLIFRGLVQSFGVLKGNVFLQPNQQFAHRGVAVVAQVFVFDAPPKPFHKDIFIGSATTLHADGDFLTLKNVCKDLAGELTALITSDLPCSRKASSKQLTQNTASMLLLIRQLSTRRE